MKKSIIMALAVSLCLIVNIFGMYVECKAEPETDVEKEEVTGSWNLFDSEKWFEDFIVDANTGLYVEKPGYGALEMIPVNEENVYAIFLPDGNNVNLVFYDLNQMYMGGKVMSAPKGAFLEIPSGCGYVTISMAQAEVANSFLVQDEANGVFVVAKDSPSRYDSVKSAVSAVKEEGTIIVMPGNYRGNIQAWGKIVHIIGVDRDTCVIENGSGAYAAPPLEIAAGTVKNITVKARGTNPEGSGAGNTDPGAYGIHVEDNALCDNKLVFENCYIYSDFNSAVGMGLRGGCMVSFADCYLKGKEDGLFCHDAAAKKYSGEQNLTMTNCVLEGMQGKRAVRFDSQGTTGATVKVMFVNNLLKNKKSEALLSTRNNGGKGDDENWMKLKNYYLEEGSIGNSISELNY